MQVNTVSISSIKSATSKSYYIWIYYLDMLESRTFKVRILIYAFPHAKILSLNSLILKQFVYYHAAIITALTSGFTVLPLCYMLKSFVDVWYFLHSLREKRWTHNNNDKSYIALYPVKIYKLAALYIINIKIRLTIKTKKQQKNSTITINACINIELTTTTTKSQVETQ